MVSRLFIVFSLASVGVCAAQPLSEPGEFQAGFRRVTVVPSQGASFSALVYYPALTPGENAPLDPAGAPYPGVSFGHGFLQAPSRYGGTLSHLATWGVIVIASESQQGFTPSHSQFALDIRECLTWLESENANAASFLFNAVDTANFGVCGHSMGGGAGTLAAADDPRVKALATLAAAETSPSAIAAAARLTIPASFISGSEDFIVPVGTHGQRMYDAMTAPRLLPLVVGGSHCGFQDVPYPLFCDSGSMPRAEQLALTRSMLTTFFLLHLRDRQDLWSHPWGPAGVAEPRVTVQRDARTSVVVQAAIDVPAGSRVMLPTTVRNTGASATPLRVLVEASPWTFEATPPVTPIIPPGGEHDVMLTTGVPREAIGAFEVLITARRESDGATRAYAPLAVDVRCFADCDVSSGRGVLDIFDFLCFGNRFAVSDPYACDCDTSTGVGVCDIFDLLCFGNAFDAGCS